MEQNLGAILSTLYAPGLGVAAPARWPAVVRAVRQAGEAVPAAEALAQKGLGLEALLLGERPKEIPTGLVTACDERLGALWPLAGRVARGLAGSAVEISLDAPALPPAVWIEGESPEARRPTLAGVGCRQPSPEAETFARQVGARAAQERVTLVSGGAEGCDAAFAEGHGSAVAVLPHGLGRPRDLPGTAAQVSAFPRFASFSRELAMRRNALIVAAADLTLVASARLREGGTWHAAMGALRRRAPVAVYVGTGQGTGADALVALGALPIRDADEALAALQIVRNLRPSEDAVERWAYRRGATDGRLQPRLRLEIL